MFKRTSENVCLIIDDSAAHGAALQELEGAENILLPPDVTPLFLAMYIGITAAIKRHARNDIML